MQVLDHHHLGPLLGSANQQAPESRQRLATALNGAHRPHVGVAGVHGQKCAQVGHGSREVAIDVPYAALELGGDGGLAVGVVDAHPSADQVHERVEGHGLAEREAVSFLPDGRLSDPTAQLEEQP